MRSKHLLLLLPLLFWAGGCAANVYPPSIVVDPVPVYLADYDVHSTILFPDGDKYIDYSFGDWNYAALHHKLPNDAIGALTLSWASTLEKRTIPIDPHTGGPILNDNPISLIRIYANRQAVQRRLDALTKRFDDDVKNLGSDGMMVYDNGATIYVRDAQHYSIANNCNHMTADSLRALGFRVDGPIVANQFHLNHTQ